MPNIIENGNSIAIEQLIVTAKRHRLLAVLLIVFCIFLEAWFIKFPPRGMIATDVIVLGTVKGQPLISFEQIWKRFVFDDQFLLETAENAGFFTNETLEEKLGALSKVRKSLSFEIDKDFLVKISFRQPSSDKVRTFLNSFTINLVEKLKLLIGEEFEQKREGAEKNLQQLENRVKFLQKGFQITQEGDIVGQMVKSGFLTACGNVLENELSTPLHNARKALAIYTDEKWNFLSLYPRTPKVLTDSKTLPQPIQPFYALFLLLIPVGIFLMYAGIVIILSQQKTPPYKN